MPALLSVPKELLCEILSQWLTLENCVILDSAVTDCCGRHFLLETFSDVVQHFVTFKPAVRYKVYQWIMTKRIKFEELRIDGSFELNDFRCLNTSLVRRLCLELRNSNASDFVNACPLLQSLQLNCYAACCSYLNFNAMCLSDLRVLQIEGACFGDGLVKALVQTAPRLEEIAATEVSISNSAWCNFIESKPNLKIIRISSVAKSSLILRKIMEHCEGVTNIDIHDTERVDLLVLSRLVQRCPRLKFVSVEFANLSMVEWTSGRLFGCDSDGCECTGFSLQVNKVDIAAPGFFELLTACQYSSLLLSELLDSPGVDIIPIIGQSRFTLMLLSLQNLSWLNSEDLHAILVQCSVLQRVTLHSWYVSNKDYVDAFRDPLKIDSLTLIDNAVLSTDTVTQILAQCHDLTECCLEDCPLVDKLMVQGSTRVRVLGVHG